MNRILSFVKLDYAALKPYIKSIYMFVVIVVFMGLVNDSISLMFTMVMVGLPMILTYPFAISEKNNLDTLYSTLSLDRKDVVVGRYAFVLINEIIAILVLVIVAIIKSNFKPLDMSSEELVLYVCILSMFFSFIVSFQYPILFKLGYSKAKLYTYIPMMIIFFLIGLFPSIVQRLNLNIDLEAVGHMIFTNLVPISLLTFSLGIIFLVLSALISMKIYEKKDI
ncbi:MAG: ABC-2 transporter permease [Clostridiales bacterium]|nr:ABC-2 transporter permease [Clostridiales bacterium]